MKDDESGISVLVKVIRFITNVTVIKSTVTEQLNFAEYDPFFSQHTTYRTHSNVIGKCMQSFSFTLCPTIF